MSLGEFFKHKFYVQFTNEVALLSVTITRKRAIFKDDLFKNHFI